MVSMPAGDARQHMDGIYRYQRHIYDATRKFFLLGRDRLLDDLRPTVGSHVLEIGCGTGRNLILAALRYPRATFYGLDVSEMMLETARASIARAGLDGRIVVAAADATSFESEALFGRRAFDRVFISYALSMIPPWREATARALSVVADSGSLHIVDFGQQHGLPAWFRAAHFAWLRRFTVEPRADLEAELAALAARTGAGLNCRSLFRGYSQYAVIART
jgi:S-adenosylmethionine-diacylgycerolhomoserine-N-methlytransferase